MQKPKIIESYTDCGINIGSIVKRIVDNAPNRCLDDLELISLLDSDPHNKGFACYLKEEREIRLFVKAIVGWQPWILKKTYIFPYITVGLALGHEIDHHVNRANNSIDRELSAKNNAIKYIYPSLGLFKPFVKMVMLLKSNT